MELMEFTDSIPNAPMLSDEMGAELRELKVTSDRIACLHIAMMNSIVNPQAETYANGMEKAFNRHGLIGLAWNIDYLLGNLTRWRGDEARKVKAELKKWSKDITNNAT